MSRLRSAVRRRIRLAAALAALAAASLAAAGCGERREAVGPGRAQPFELMLDFFPNADHAGIYAAQANGHFADEGLDVRIRQPSDPATPIKLVAAGRVDLAISYEPELLRARDEGRHMVAVGALVRAPLTSIISLPQARIARPADLRGKVVGTAGIDYQSAYLRTVLAGAHVPPGSVKERNVGFNLVPALLTRKVDAILGGFWNYEGVQLRQQRRDPRIIRIDRAGVPVYDELVLVANEDTVRSDPGRIRRFVAALALGTRDLRRDPGSAIQGLLKANRDLDPRLQRASVAATLLLFSPPAGRPYGYQDPGQWSAFGRWMRAHGLLKRPPGPGAFTNRLLPGEGL
jgi:putative hydroxymethylpyrimidine transport system substrate-binding protein